VQIQRRGVLAMAGAAALGAAAGGFGIGALIRNEKGKLTVPAPSERVTYQGWLQRRRPPYFIGHRGAGDVVPEHTLPSYQTALDWGADAIEISVVRSADEEVYCLHDLTLDRTTTASGPAAAQSSSSLDKVRVAVPRLGPRWTGTNMPVLSRLTDVLAAIGGRAVLCLEAKDDDAYPLMTRIVEEYGLQDSVMIKLSGSATDRLRVAKKAGYPIYAYLGNPEVATADEIARLARRLDPDVDALVLPAQSGADLFPSDLIRRAVDIGVPVWVVPVHRRYEVEYFADLGVEGMVSPDISYLSTTQPMGAADNWAQGAISAGELTLDPYRDKYGLHWEERGAIGLDVPGRSAFVTLGQFCPLPANSYRLEFDAAFDPLPTDTWQHLSVAFAHADDRYYEHRAATSNGYHALLRADGQMAIYAHTDGDPNGKALTIDRKATPFETGSWTRLTLDVTPRTIRLTRDDGSYVEAQDARFRGGYFHIGRSGTDGKLKIRNLQIS
jgi:glycerophosphoryl diester phosphodiesterase